MCHYIPKVLDLKYHIKYKITLGKKNTLHTRRQALSFITKEDVVTKLFNEIAPKYAERNGGYTRILKTAPRKGDGAEMAILELVD